MTERKKLSKKVRFEVFKRDSFTCQYCGRTAPEIVLHLDHIQPLSQDGDEDVLNYVTSCVDCNLGKSDRLLSDDSVVAKQRAQLDQLQERREQLEMMLEWREGLKSLDSEIVEIAAQAFMSALPVEGWGLQEQGRRDLARHIKKHTLQAVLDAIDIATGHYLRYDAQGALIPESAITAFNKIGGICGMASVPDWKRELYYMRGIARKRFSYCNDWKIMKWLDRAHQEGTSLETLKELVCTAKNWTEFRDRLYALQGWEGEVTNVN